MKKIPSLFVRDRATGLVTDDVTPGCEWVAAGEGLATRKWDGTACLIRDGRLFKRHEVKRGGTPPAGFEACGETDPVTGKTVGWVPIGSGPEDRWHREAFERPRVWFEPTLGGWSMYELCGPKIQGNPEELPIHILIGHWWWILELHGLQENGPTVPRDYKGLKRYLSVVGFEGIVWHRGNGDMAKAKCKDFGFPRPRVCRDDDDDPARVSFLWGADQRDRKAPWEEAPENEPETADAT